MKIKINCKWKNDLEKIVVNPDGQVYPCCYLCNFAYQRHSSNNEKLIADSLMRIYDSKKEDNNIFNNNLEDILEGEWFTKSLPENWESEMPSRTCRRYCGEIVDD